MKHILLAVALLIGFQSFAQKEKKEKEKKAKDETKSFYKEATFETDDYVVNIVDAVAAADFSKFKMKVFNKTNDYLLIRTSEIGYSADGKKLTNKEKDFIVGPNDESNKVIDFKGINMQVPSYVIELKGIYKASAGGKVLSADNFDLPPSKNDFTTGGFTCTLKKHDANTDKVVARFDCIYSGDAIGIINPNKSAAIMPNNTDNANAKKNKPMLLEKGKMEEFIVQYNEVEGAGDLQKKAIKIKWNDTFRESKLLPLESPKITVEKKEEVKK